MKKKSHVVRSIVSCLIFVFVVLIMGLEILNNSILYADYKHRATLFIDKHLISPQWYRTREKKIDI